MVDLVNFGGPQFSPNARGNQQGTLFSNRALNRANRTGDEVGHKGFSPNRMAEVRSAVQFQTTGSDADLTPRGAAVRDAGGGQKGNNVSAADIKETIARSTIPSAHLDRITRGGEYPQTVRLDGAMQPGTGVYNTSGGDIEISPKGFESTLIHEVGHAVDFEAYGQSDVTVRNKALPGQQSGSAHNYDDVGDDPVRGRKAYEELGQKVATQEGFADAYADRHAKDHRGRPVVNLSGYSKFTEGNWAGYGEEPQFDPGDDAGGRKAAYRQARKLHGGRNLVRPPDGHNYDQPRLKDPDTGVTFGASR